MVSYLIDAFLAVMLVTTTGYMLVVNRRLKTLRSGQAEMNDLMTTFARTVDETDASVKRLVATATDVAGALGTEMERGGTLKEEMELLLTACDRTTARMDESLNHARLLLRRLDETAAARAGRRSAEAPTAVPQEDEFRVELRAEPALRPKDGPTAAAGEFYATLRTVAQRV